MESKQKPDPDAYDAEDAASSTSGSNDDGSDGSDAESQDQDINDEIRGQDIPDQPQPMAPDSLPLFGDGHPISSAGATVATPAHPAPETTPRSFARLGSKFSLGFFAIAWSVGRRLTVTGVIR